LIRMVRGTLPRLLVPALVAQEIAELECASA